MKPKEEEVEYDRDLLTDDKLSSFSLLNRMRRDMQLLTPEETGALGNSRVDTQAAAALLEALLPIKFAIFQVNFGLHTLCESDCYAYQCVCSEPEAMIMQPVVLVVIVMSEAYFDKTVMQPKKESMLKESILSYQVG